VKIHICVERKYSKYGRKIRFNADYADDLQKLFVCCDVLIFRRPFVMSTAYLTVYCAFDVFYGGEKIQKVWIENTRL